jgi:hypothetical protein
MMNESAVIFQIVQIEELEQKIAPSGQWDPALSD